MKFKVQKSKFTKFANKKQKFIIILNSEELPPALMKKDSLFHLHPNNNSNNSNSLLPSKTATLSLAEVVASIPSKTESTTHNLYLLAQLLNQIPTIWKLSIRLYKDYNRQMVIFYKGNSRPVRVMEMKLIWRLVHIYQIEDRCNRFGISINQTQKA